MKKKVILRTVTGILIFLLILTAVFFALRPFYRTVNLTFDRYEKKLNSYLSEKTGLLLTYESMSPSILTGIRIKGIAVQDVSTGEKILTINRVNINYSIREFIRKDLDHAFTEFSVFDVNFDYDSEKCRNVQDKIQLLVKDMQEEEESDVFISHKLRKSIKDILFRLPFDVDVRNVNFHCSLGGDEYSAKINEAVIRKNNTGSSLTGTLTGTASASLKALGMRTAGFTVGMKGELQKNIDGSSLLISLDNLEKASYSIRDVSLLVTYGSGKINARTVQYNLPYNLFASVDADSGTFDAEFRSTELNPFRMFRIPSDDENLLMWNGSKLTTSTSFHAGLLTGELDWSSNTSFIFSRNIFDRGQSLAFDVKGDSKMINLKYLKAEGAFADADFSGKFDLEKMQPQGSGQVHYITLPNGNKISFDLFVDPSKNSTVFYIPEFVFGDRKFSWLELDVFSKENSLDFTFTMNDFSHEDFNLFASKPSSVRIDGSLSLEDESYFQAVVAVNNLFLDGAVSAAGWFLDEPGSDSISSAAASLESYIMSTEFYVSTDFKSVTYNCPNALFANTKEDRQFVILSFDGSETSLHVSQAGINYGSNSFMATLNAEYSPEDEQAIFQSDVNINNIPYQLNGIYSLGEWLNISGNYGLNLVVNFDRGISGTVETTSLPVSAGGFIFDFTTEATFSIPDFDDFYVEISKFEAEEFSGILAMHPKVSFIGKADYSGIVLSSLNYSDTFSMFEGSAYGLWNINDGIFDSFNMQISLKNPLTSESIVVDGSFTNPLQEKLTMDNLMTNCFFNAQANVEDFSLRHIFSTQPDDERFSATVTFSGTVENPYVTVNLSSFSMQLAGAPLFMKGSLAYMEEIFTVPEFSASWTDFSVKDFSGSFNMKDFDGLAQCVFNADFDGQTLIVPMVMKAENLSPFETEGKVLPESFSLEIDADNIGGTLGKNAPPLHFSIIRSPGRVDIMTNEYLGAYGEYLDDGTLNFSILDDKPIHFDASGSFKDMIVNLNVSNIYIDVTKISFIFNSDGFYVHNGIVSGQLNLSGLLTDPNLDGEALIENIDFNFPDYVPEHFTASPLLVQITQDEIELPDSLFKIKKGMITANVRLALDRWRIETFEVNVRTEKNRDLPFDVKIPQLRVTGFAGGYGSMIWEGDDITIDGNFTVHDTKANVITNTGLPLIDFSEPTQADIEFEEWFNTLNFYITASVKIAQKVEVEVKPFIRTLIAPNTDLFLSMDTDAGLWSLKGDVVLRGGEVSYLNRNFYLKEGSISLNENQSNFDPLVTIRGQINERDASGDPVLITLSAIKQHVSDFDPVLSSSPAKSESELMEILGQIIAGDSTSASDVLVSSLDYSVQVTFLRRLEGALRDLCNFDIFSVRTTLVQNSIKQGFNMNSDSEKGALISNLFDNTTVYIGKYFGSNIYVDAMMNWTYDENKNTSGDAFSGGLVFHPEMGLELDSPFANIRWSFAPDMESLQQTWVQSTSITLSWRFNF
ncbi:translocation/assembly module TamB domain-containing protein [Treponema sp.]|uniref:translocation/assembly module TamB domain-containing protein n=1 Tax=Treponema sp. TaxID=166 RepID=UPI00258072C5|nr:translocation/assembly module TamB domain-containing protein [Treponema sp.]MBE6353548.1 hypothetical protein [Treponema sp.]